MAMSIPDDMASPSAGTTSNERSPQLPESAASSANNIAATVNQTVDAVKMIGEIEAGAVGPLIEDPLALINDVTSRTPIRSTRRIAAKVSRSY